MKFWLIKTTAIVFVLLMIAGSGFAQESADVILVFDVSGSMNWAIDVPQGYENGQQYLADLEEYEPIPFPTPSDLADRSADLRTSIDNYEAEMSEFIVKNKLDKYKYIRLDAAKRASSSILELLQELNANTGFVTFSENAEIEYQLSHDYRQLANSIKQVSARGSTNIGGGMSKALDQLEASKNGVIILFTDGRITEGLTREELLDFGDAFNPVIQAKKANIKICTIGFGSKKAIDEELLQEIAKQGNCSYAFGGNLYEFNVALTDAVQTAATKSFKKVERTIKQDQKVKAEVVFVAEGTDKIIVSLIWPGSELGLEIIGPDGKKHYPSITGTDHAFIVIENPLPGNYEVFVEGKQVTMPEEKYTLILSSEGKELKKAELPAPQEDEEQEDNTIIILSVIVLIIIGAAAFLVLKKTKKI